MRKTLLFLLAASVAAPALAADEGEDRGARREAARAERAERAEARAERRSERAQESQTQEAPAAARSVERTGGGGVPAVRDPERPAIRQQVMERRPERGPERGFSPDSGRPAVEQRVIERSTERSPGPKLVRPTLEQRSIEPRSRRAGDIEPVRPTLEERRVARDSVADWRRAEREQLGSSRPAVIERQTAEGWESLRERRREVTGRDSIGNRRAPMVSSVPREGTQPPTPAAARPSSLTAQHWRGDWRSDHRYDWRKHRNRHRNLFHFGFYFDPFGWSYRPFSIGWRMWPHYYRSSYWLNDPWRYRLPYAPPGHRWIRYYDDLLLVDTWDGTVVDVIYNFFW